MVTLARGYYRRIRIITCERTGSSRSTAAVTLASGFESMSNNGVLSKCANAGQRAEKQGSRGSALVRSVRPRGGGEGPRHPSGRLPWPFRPRSTKAIRLCISFKCAGEGTAGEGIKMRNSSQEGDPRPSKGIIPLRHPKHHISGSRTPAALPRRWQPLPTATETLLGTGGGVARPFGWENDKRQP